MLVVLYQQTIGLTELLPEEDIATGSQRTHRTPGEKLECAHTMGAPNETQEG